jgi:LmbE family N-acetylglucosaminyl deacetylase
MSDPSSPASSNPQRKRLNLLGARRLVAVGAHPDDIELGCLGTLLRLGPDVRIHAFVGSMGSAGDPSSGPSRIEESRNAFQSLELASFEYRDQKGITHADFGSLLEQLTDVLERAQPNVILTQGPKDTHQEHRIIWDVCLAAARRVQASILHYAVVSNTPDFTPNVFVDISETYAEKKRALTKHRSQQGKQYMSTAHLDIFHGNTYASLHGIPCSEAYELVRGFF